MIRKIKILSFILIFLLTTGYFEEIQGHGDRKGSLSPKALKERLGEIKLLDIRSEKDYEKEHIHTAFVIPLEELSESNLTQLGFHKTEEIVVYANSDAPAKKAKLLLEVMGFSAVKILSGGLVHWKEDGFSTTSGKMDMIMKGKTKKIASSISIEPKEHDFGMITKKGGSVKTTLALTNDGEEEVSIEEITTSCGCTSAKVSNKVITPGNSVSLQINFDPNFHEEPPGRFSRTVFLKTSEGLELQAKIYVQIKD